MRNLWLLAFFALALGLASTGWAQPLTLGGGPTLCWLALEFGELNEHLAQARLPLLEPGLFLSGASYFGERGRGPALVGLAVSGQNSASRLDKAVRLGLSLAGLGLEYGEKARPPWQFGLLVGGFVAPASLTLEVTLRPAKDFESGLEEPSGTSLSREFLALAAYAGGEWALDIGRLRLSLGYLWAGATTNWRADGRDFPGPSGAFRGPLVQVVFVLDWRFSGQSN